MGCTRSKYVQETMPVQRKMISQFSDVDLSRLENGDIILFSNPKTITGKAIWYATSSIWTHCGVVIRLDTLFPGYGTLMLETNKSYNDNLIDISTGTVKTEGTRIVRLEERIRSSNDSGIAFMKCYKPKITSAKNYTERVEHEAKIMTRILGKVSPLPYEKSTKQLLFSAIDMGPLTNNKEDLSSLFCSELVAYTLRQLDVLQMVQPDNEYTPGDFARKKFKKSLAPGYAVDGPFNLKVVQYVSEK